MQGLGFPALARLFLELLDGGEVHAVANFGDLPLGSIECSVAAVFDFASCQFLFLEGIGNRLRGDKFALEALLQNQGFLKLYRAIRK